MVRYFFDSIPIRSQDMYDGATYFAWFVIALLFLIAVALIVWLGSLPKQIATRRNNPQVESINACSWIGLACGGVGWPIAFVWAFLKTAPKERSSVDNESEITSKLRSEIKTLQARIAELEQTKTTKVTGE